MSEQLHDPQFAFNQPNLLVQIFSLIEVMRFV